MNTERGLLERCLRLVVMANLLICVNGMITGDFFDIVFSGAVAAVGYALQD